MHSHLSGQRVKWGGMQLELGDKRVGSNQHMIKYPCKSIPNKNFVIDPRNGKATLLDRTSGRPFVFNNKGNPLFVGYTLFSKL